MIILVTGTPGSGKSRKAEELVLELSGPEDRYYIATMLPYGEEGAKRVEKHRKYREGKGFVTIEQPFDLSEVFSKINRPEEATLLLECVTNLVANEMFARECAEPETLTQKILADIQTVSQKVKRLVLVTNSFDEEEGTDEETKLYIRVMNELNRRLKQISEEDYFTADAPTTAGVISEKEKSQITNRSLSGYKL